MRMRASAIVRTKSMASMRSALRERRAGNGDQHVDRHALGVLGQVCKRHQHVDAVLGLLAHADDAAGAHLDARVAHARQRLEAIGEACAS